jgi:radical SAM superfamily enzyme YgiQ (UPF0313 family)
MQIALVNPVTRRTQGYHTIGTFLPQLGLQVLAKLTPPGHTIDIIDECFGTDQTESLLAAKDYDVVGITGYTSGATRAYELAASCRKRGIPVVMGGPHASACPVEAAEFVDSVAVGECDNVWPEIIEDVQSQKLQKIYMGKLSDLEETGYGGANQEIQPINGRYHVSGIQTSRGCPVGCEYCSVTNFNGAPIRRRRIGDIVEEWNRTRKGFMFVVDDNFFGVGEKHAEWAKELLRALIKHGKKRHWFSQTTINMGDDDEGMRLAYKAGCRGMFVGFESFNSASLQNYHKGINRKNLDRYHELVGGFHRAGIAVFGGFIIGSDDDTVETVADTALAAARLGVDIIQITNLTPLPGTKLYDRFKESGRLLATNWPEDWESYTFTETVFQPAKMSARDLDEALSELRYAAAKKSWVIRRALRTLMLTRSPSTALFVLGMNHGYKKLAKKQTLRDQERFGVKPVLSDRFSRIKRSFAMHMVPKPVGM